MALPDVGQAQALASEFGRLLEERRPASVAVLGCSGGNGLERVDPAVTTRVVALDLNPAYVEATRVRFDRRFRAFEPVVCDVALAGEAPFRPVEFLFAGLVLEYVSLPAGLRFVRSGLERGGLFGCITQQASETLERVSPSPFSSLAALAPHMRLHAPGEVARRAGECGLRVEGLRTLLMPNGKVLVSQVFSAA
ncbi:MAG TPA: class I SAM-dependent methyltransferase [Thermoanaerobaculia bacterium]